MAYYFDFYCFTLIILNIHWNKWIEIFQASMHRPLNSVTKCFPNMLDSESVVITYTYLLLCNHVFCDTLMINPTRAESVSVCICPLAKPVPMCIYRDPNTKGKLSAKYQFCAIQPADNSITDGKVRMVRPIVRQLFTVSSVG